VNLKNSGSKTSYTITGLKKNATYAIMMKARTYFSGHSDIADGAWSGTVKIKTLKK